MAKALNAGRAAENGVVAAELARDGFTAAENIFEAPMGFFSAASRNKVDRAGSRSDGVLSSLPRGSRSNATRAPA
jgi:2-methylcitrate dehydratase PrpD